ncbi:hypothetical protein [Pseudonocardia sp. NPDC049154]|uniref:hypothetical protein n=1 Tax=Pseudonocardia sp. NPDC049154 TaxID=3155501 RepID=UPI00340630B9
MSTGPHGTRTDGDPPVASRSRPHQHGPEVFGRGRASVVGGFGLVRGVLGGNCGAIRIIGYSTTAGFVITVIATGRAHAGVTAWKSSGADLRDYEGTADGPSATHRKRSR